MGTPTTGRLLAVAPPPAAPADAPSAQLGIDFDAAANRMEHIHHTVDDVTHAAVVAAAVTGAQSPATMIPLGVHLGAGHVFRDHRNGEKIAIHSGLAADGMYELATALRGSGGHAHATPQLLQGAGGASAQPSLLDRLRSGSGTAAGTLETAAKVTATTYGTLEAAAAVQHGGVRALVDTERGRGGALTAAGGALLLVPHSMATAAGAGAMLLALGNDVGMLSRFDRAGGEFPGPRSGHGH